MLLLLVSCEDPIASKQSTAVLLVDVGESGGFAAVDGNFDLLGHFGDFARIRTPMVLDSDREVVYFLATGELPAELVVFSTERLAAQYRELTSAINARSQIGSVEIYGRRALVALEDQSIILDGVRNGVRGIVRLSGQPYEPVRFSGPFFLAVDGAALLGSSLFAVASRTDDGPRFLFEIDPVTLAVRDSIEAVTTRQPIASPDGRHVFLLGSELLKFDTSTGEFVAAAMNPSRNPHSRLHVSRNGQRLYLTDPGNYFESTGPGIIHTWTSNLDTLPAVDLRAATGSSGGVPPIAAGFATSIGGDTLFIATGTRSLGPLFGPQPGTLLILDSDSHALLDQVDLEGWTPGPVLMLF